MSWENKETIEVYENYAKQYLERNESDEVEEKRRGMLKNCLAGLSKEAKIFEVGSASGNDAEYFQSLGYKNIIVSDVADSFLGILRKKGLHPLKFDLIENNFFDKYDFIYCWAVLMHFTKDEAKAAIKKMFDALNDGGKLLTCVKSAKAQSEKWSNFQDEEDVKIYFSFWSERELRDYLDEVGFKKNRIWKYGDWIDCLAEK